MFQYLQQYIPFCYLHNGLYMFILFWALKFICWPWLLLSCQLVDLTKPVVSVVQEEWKGGEALWSSSCPFSPRPCQVSSLLFN